MSTLLHFIVIIIDVSILYSSIANKTYTMVKVNKLSHLRGINADTAINNAWRSDSIQISLQKSLSLTHWGIAGIAREPNCTFDTPSPTLCLSNSLSPNSLKQLSNKQNDDHSKSTSIWQDMAQLGDESRGCNEDSILTILSHYFCVFFFISWIENMTCHLNVAPSFFFECCEFVSCCYRELIIFIYLYLYGFSTIHNTYRAGVGFTEQNCICFLTFLKL